MRPSELTNKISGRIAQDIASGTLTAGDHVGAQQIADRYGVSRTPVREALISLESMGVLKRLPNRGYFVAEKALDETREIMANGKAAETDDYQRMAEDWLTDQLPEEVTEQGLRQRYGFTKTKVNDLLARAAREGWAEPKDGYGWRLLPVAKTAEAFDEIYRFRMAIEPAAMLEPTFELDKKILAEQRSVQERMLDMDLTRMPPETLLENGTTFHEELIKLSQNPFFLMALKRVNRMRRLLEYRAKVNPERVIEQTTEHLELLRLLETGEVAEASYFMRRHLSGALNRKSPVARDWTEDVKRKAK